MRVATAIVALLFLVAAGFWTPRYRVASSNDTATVQISDGDDLELLLHYFSGTADCSDRQVVVQATKGVTVVHVVASGPVTLSINARELDHPLDRDFCYKLFTFLPMLGETYALSAPRVGDSCSLRMRSSAGIDIPLVERIAKKRTPLTDNGSWCEAALEQQAGAD